MRRLDSIGATALPGALLPILASEKWVLNKWVLSKFDAIGGKEIKGEMKGWRELN